MGQVVKWAAHVNSATQGSAFFSSPQKGVKREKLAHFITKKKDPQTSPVQDMWKEIHFNTEAMTEGGADKINQMM